MRISIALSVAFIAACSAPMPVGFHAEESQAESPSPTASSGPAPSPSPAADAGAPVMAKPADDGSLWGYCTYDSAPFPGHYVCPLTKSSSASCQVHQTIDELGVDMYLRCTIECSTPAGLADCAAVGGTCHKLTHQTQWVDVNGNVITDPPRSICMP